MRIAVVGTGYVGLVSGTCFAEFGTDVTCVDKDSQKIEKLNKGEIPIYEPGLEALVEKQVGAGRLSFTTDITAAVEKADAVFIAVGTPSRRSDGNADISYVFQAARDVAQAMKGYTVVVMKSTVPVGTGKEVDRIIREERPDADFDVCSNPEFLREGAAISDFMRPDRVVIGTHSQKAKDVMKELYRPLYINETPMVITTPESAEIIKYASNAFLATKITFINEIANLCEVTGGDVQVVAKAMGIDGRIGSKFLHAGPGFGGSCFPKDTLALTQIGQQHGAAQNIVETVVWVNAERQRSMAERVIEALDGNVSDKRVGILGLSFKPGTDDVRDSPSLTIIPLLQEEGAKIAAYDPQAMEEAQKHLDNVEWCEDPYAVAQNADVLVIVTEWNEFRGLDLGRLAQEMKSKCLVDMRNIYNSEDLKAKGFKYIPIGKPPLCALSDQSIAVSDEEGQLKKAS